MNKSLLKVIIVDDEYLVRNLLKNCVKWQEIGMEIVGEAGNSLETLDLIQNIVPDILFVDINMPNMNGIELSKAVIGKFPNIKIVILTGYEEFEYAKSGIKIGISDYLTKPIIADEIIQSALKVKNKIEKERESKFQFENLKRRIVYLENYSSSGKEEGIEENKDMLEDKMSNDLIKKIKKYVEENLSDYDLSLQKTGSDFYVNQCYLSRLFKQKTGVNYIDYITNLRIQKAIDMLKGSNMKIYEIAEKVGFSDPHYFGVCFKKYTGKSISEYKRESDYQLAMNKNCKQDML